MISVIICSADRARFRTVSAMYHRVLAGEPFEIVGVHNAESMCEGYNHGLQTSRGDLLIFSHDDVEIITPHLRQRLQSHLSQFDIVGIAGTSRLVSPAWMDAGYPYLHGKVVHGHKNGSYTLTVFNTSARLIPGIQALDGVFFAAKRKVAESLRFDEKTFRGFHFYDIDFMFRAYLAGYKLAVCNDIGLIHRSPGNFGAAWQSEAKKFCQKFARKLDLNAIRKNGFTWVRLRSIEEIKSFGPYWSDRQ